jgi:hypothetical protein
MPREKADLQKHTLNLRTGDFDKIGQLFPNMDSSTAIRTLLSKFIDNNWKKARTPRGLDTDIS